MLWGARIVGKVDGCRVARATRQGHVVVDGVGDKAPKGEERWKESGEEHRWLWGGIDLMSVGCAFIRRDWG